MQPLKSFIHISILWYITTANFLYANSDEENFGNVVITEITSIYDGDTFRCTIKDWPRIIGYRIPVRVAGIDCPELKDNRPEIKELARKAKQHTVQRL